MLVISAENGFFDPLPGHISHDFRLNCQGKSDPPDDFICIKCIVVTIRGNEWAVRCFSDVTIQKFSFFLSLQTVFEFTIPLNI